MPETEIPPVLRGDIYLFKGVFLQGRFLEKAAPAPPQKLWTGLVLTKAGLLCLNDTLCEHLSREKSFKVLLNFFQKIAGCRGSALTKKSFGTVFTASF